MLLNPEVVLVVWKAMYMFTFPEGGSTLKVTGMRTLKALPGVSIGISKRESC